MITISAPFGVASSADRLLRSPMIGSTRCCASAGIGQNTAAPSNAVNSRRFMDRPSGNGLMLHPQVHSQSARLIRAEQAEPGSARAPEASSLSTTALAEMERMTILRVFEQAHGDKALAGKMLGISRATLYRKLKRYNIIPLKESEEGGEAKSTAAPS